MKYALVGLLLSSSLAWAAPKERMEERERRSRMMFLVGVAEALKLSDAEALRMADKFKGFEDRRRPLREQMMEAMKTLKAAADGDAAALSQVDAATAKVLDGREKMAALDREMFQTVSRELSPQRR